MIGRDVRHALRLLRHQPAFTAVALITLALGIGATTSIFSVVNAIVLRPLPYEQSDRLMLIFENNLQKGWTTFAVAPANFVDWARESRAFESMTAVTSSGNAAIIIAGEAEQVPATTASAEYFTVLRAAPAIGRTFVIGDDGPGAPPVTVIGHGFWQRRFGGDPSAVGRVVTINDRPTTIVGVMQKGFGQGTPGTDLWLPLTMDRARAERGGRSLNVVGRLAANISQDQAQSEMTAIAGRLAALYPEANQSWGATLVPLEQAIVGPSVRGALIVLLGAVGFVLLIACVNVANLLSARGVARQREMAIRAAIGASRWHLVRQLLTESLVLAMAGGVLGVFIAVWGTEALLMLAPRNLPRLLEVSIDGRVLLTALAATVAAAFIFGLIPALQTIAARPDDTLRDVRRTGTANPGRRRVSQMFVVAETGLAVVLLVGAGLFTRSFIRLSNQPIGFDPDHALVFRVALPETRYANPEAVSVFYRDLLTRLRALPGVSAVGGIHALPFSGVDSVRPFVVEGERFAAGTEPTSEYRIITPGYFAAMGIPVLKGRDFTDADGAGRPGAVIVNESFAKRFLVARDPIGLRLRQAGGGPDVPWLTVVGVAGDVRHFGLSADVRPEMFWPEPQATWGATLNRHRRGLTVVLRTAGQPTDAIPLIRPQLASIDPNRPVIEARPMRDLVAHSADVQRFSMVLLALFAGVGLALAGAGVYGVMSYTVAAQRREMGIRLALGARPRALLAQVLRAGVTLAAVGAVLGLAAAWMLDDVLRVLLFQTSARDAPTFATVATVLIGTATVACYLPARRAASVDPIQALHDE